MVCRESSRLRSEQGCDVPMNSGAWFGWRGFLRRGPPGPTLWAGRHSGTLAQVNEERPGGKGTRRTVGAEPRCGRTRGGD